MQVDVASAEAIDSVLRQIQQILEAASTGHCVTGLEPQTLEGPLYTKVNIETEVSLVLFDLAVMLERWRVQ